MRGNRVGIDRELKRTVDNYIYRKTGSYDDIKIAVIMVRTLGKTEFEVNDRDHNIRFTSDSIDAVLQHIDNVMKGRIDIEWKKFIQIDMKAMISRQPRNSSVKREEKLFEVSSDIDIEAVELGIDANGKKYLRPPGSQFIQEYNGAEGFFPYHGSKPTDKYYHSDQSKVLIPDTDENREALARLVDRFDDLHQAIFQIIGNPERIMKTMADMLKADRALPAFVPDGQKGYADISLPKYEELLKMIPEGYEAVRQDDVIKQTDLIYDETINGFAFPGRWLIGQDAEWTMLAIRSKFKTKNLDG